MWMIVVNSVQCRVGLSSESGHCRSISWMIVGDVFQKAARFILCVCGLLRSCEYKVYIARNIIYVRITRGVRVTSERVSRTGFIYYAF